MAHRIRYAMTQEPLSSKLDGVVEIDETYIGGKRKRPNNRANRPVPMESKEKARTTRRGPAPGTNVRADKAAVLSLVQGGKVRSIQMERVTSDELRPVLDEMLADGTRVMTDSSTALKSTTGGRWRHDTVNHTRGE